MILTVSAVVVGFSSLTAPAGAAELKVGVAVADITPPKGYRMAGYFSERLHTGTHDPLLAKAMVLEQGGERAALVFCDLCAIPSGITSRARRLAEESTGIPAANILISATHSHTGPEYFGVLRDHFHKLAVEKLGKDPREEVDYPAMLLQRLVRAITEAQAAGRPAKLEAGIAHETRLSFNRRFHMKDGSVVFNPGKLNPNIVRPAGPIDSDVGILLVRRAEADEPIASLTVFALHLDTVGGTEYSADYPYYLEQSLRGALGVAFVSLFGNGTCGDINHIDVSHERRQGGHGEAERIGTALAETVKTALPRLEAVKSPSLAVRRAVRDVPLQQYSAEQFEQARRDLMKVGTGELPFLKQVEACKLVELEAIKGPTIPLEVQAFRLSEDVAIVGLPGEVFVELGLAIKKGSPFKTTMVIELANDAPNYVPTRKAFTEGSYETVNSLVQSGGGEMLVEAAMELLRELAR